MGPTTENCQPYIWESYITQLHYVPSGNLLHSLLNMAHSNSAPFPSYNMVIFAMLVYQRVHHVAIPWGNCKGDPQQPKQPAAPLLSTEIGDVMSQLHFQMALPKGARPRGSRGRAIASGYVKIYLLNMATYSEFSNEKHCDFL